MTRYRDRDGDVWETTPDGQLRITESEYSPYSVGKIRSEKFARETYGPLVEISDGWTPKQYRDPDGDVWQESKPGEIFLVGGRGLSHPISNVTKDCGPLVEITEDITAVVRREVAGVLMDISRNLHSNSFSIEGGPEALRRVATALRWKASELEGES